MFTLTRMAFANMTGVDREFTRSTSGPLGHALGAVILPLYLLTSGRGYKAVVGGHIVGCAFLNMRRLTGFVYNVNVNGPYRRKGIGRALMEHVEREVRRLGRRWVGLHLDDGNAPAQRLYESLGYHSYHHRFLRSAHPALLPRSSAEGLQVQALARPEGERLWKQYADLARREGDPWAARLIREDFDEGPPPGGTFWSAQQGSDVIGCLWRGGPATWPTVRVLLRHGCWDQPNLLFSLLDALLPAAGGLDGLDLHFGSSAHHDAICPALSLLAFTPHNRPRILMLKELPLL